LLSLLKKERGAAVAAEAGHIPGRMNGREPDTSVTLREA
jgi:hypothetical protein